MTFRRWVISKLFTDDEKYLMTKAIETRQDFLRSLIGEKWADNTQMKEDRHELYSIKHIFRTKLTK